MDASDLDPSAPLHTCGRRGCDRCPRVADLFAPRRRWWRRKR